jgi:hypothetical protein
MRIVQQPSSASRAARHQFIVRLLDRKMRSRARPVKPRVVGAHAWWVRACGQPALVVG